MSDTSLISDLPIPKPPRETNYSKVYPELPKEMLDRLLELKPLAQQVRGHGKMYRAEADEYTYLLNQAITTQGISVYRLAKLLSVTIGAIQFRLTRYGYRTTTGKSKCFQPILEKNRRG
jgi:cobyrinic acid a,c-diamide synthase